MVFIKRQFVFFIAVIISFSGAFSNSLKDIDVLINEKKYSEAFDSITLLNDNTAEGLYYKGLCLYYLNKDIDEAIILLSKALTANGPDKIKLVLGLIYHKQYKTAEAKKLLNEFLPLAKNSEDKDLALLYLDYCQNMNAVAHRGKNIEIRGVTKINENEIAVHYNQQSITCVLVPKSFDLNTKEDNQNKGQNTLMVLPKESDNIKYVYYSAYVPGRTDHSDIFRVKVLENGEFSEPDNLGMTINTMYDEKYPYFDNENQILYFASKGHQSIGGYDIFMSYYNVGAESWSKPINLGLPFNSSGDDYLYLPGTSDNEYYFSTNRNTEYGSVEVVKTYIPPGTDYKTLIKPTEISAFNNLNKNGSQTSEGSEYNSKINDPSYKLLVEKALHYQVKADSIQRRIHEQQQKIDVALGENRKIQLRAGLKKMQDEHKVMQEKANTHYNAVREWEIKNNISAPQVEEKPKVADDIKVYEYSPPQPANSVLNTETQVIEKKPPPVITPTPPVKKERLSDNSSTIPVKKEYTTANDLPNGVIFTIQIGVFSKKIGKESFKGLNDVFYYHITDRNLYKYSSGVFGDIESAKTYLIKVHESGFSDAFIAAYLSGKPVSIEKAIEMSQNN